MADSVQATKDAIWYLQKDIDRVEAERNEWVDAKTGLDALKEQGVTDEDNVALKEECEENIAKLDAQLAPLFEKRAALQAKLPKAPEPKFDPEKHPLLKKAFEKNEPAKPVVFNTGDLCEALWTDRQWYKAKIQTILGAASAPKYHVKFVEYDESMTVDREAIRPLVNKRKRDAEAAPPTPTVASAPSTPHVISGPASMNPDAQRTKKTLEVEKPIPHKRTIGSSKALGNRVDNWKNWNSKGVGKKIAKKDSMFRSGTTVNSRVGFTGSGAGMSETHKRVRHDNRKDAEDEDTEGGSNPARAWNNGRMRY